MNKPEIVAVAHPSPQCPDLSFVTVRVGGLRVGTLTIESKSLAESVAKQMCDSNGSERLAGNEPGHTLFSFRWRGEFAGVLRVPMKDEEEFRRLLNNDPTRTPAMRIEMVRA